MKNYISILFSFLFFICIPNINAQVSNSILENRLNQLKVYTLENGLESYILQDSGTALVHIQFTVRAGYSEQKPETTGFFQLCTSLLSSNEIEGECNSDSAVYKITTTPENIEKSLELIAKQFSNPYFSDEDIAKQLNNIKEQSEALTQTAAGFINSVIYEKIFKNEPWRHDTGIYGAIYEYSKPSAVRTILNSIIADYYTPKNSAIFISGNISAPNIENLIRKYFSNWKAASSPEITTEHITEDTAIAESYILADDALSPKYVQLVTQYTNLSPIQAGILAAALSPLPYTYSNANVVQENGKARLILQALVIYDKTESVENISNKFNQYIENKISEVVLENEGASFRRAKVLLKNQMNRIFENAKGCMQELSSFWAIGNTKKINLIQDFSSLFDEISEENQDSIKLALDKANRYSFTIINTSLAKKLDSITRDYESWYVKYKKQQDEKRLADTKDEKLFETENPKAQSYVYAMRERPTISTLMLKNDIAVTTKYNEFSSSATISFVIAGGDIMDTEGKEHLQRITAKALKNETEKVLSQLASHNVIADNPTIEIKSSLEKNILTVTCLSSDINICLQAVFSALSFGKPTPATADSLVREEKSNWTITTNDSSYQMYSKAMSYIYKGTVIPQIINSNLEILKDISYNDLIEAYNALSNADRIQIIITGNFDISLNIAETLNNTFGQLENRGFIQKIIPTPEFPRIEKKVKLNHFFLSVPEPKGRLTRPEILIPTTVFADPVQIYFTPPTVQSNEEAIFSALLIYIAKELEQRLTKNAYAKAYTATVELPIASLALSGITNHNDAKKTYTQTIKALKQIFESNDEVSIYNTINEIKNDWIVQKLADTESNEGIAKLLAEGLKTQNFTWYINQYEAIEQADKNTYQNILNKWFPETPDILIYSASN